MKFIKLNFLILLFIVTQKGFSQQYSKINGIVKDTAGNNLSDVIIIASSHQKQFFASTSLTGQYSLTIPYLKGEVINFTFKNINYEEKRVNLTLDSNLINIGIIYLKDKQSYLSEVIVKNKSVTKLGDTTTFNISLFKNKLDINLEDVLKKMPGMDVDENGNIKYNNKPIENIMIEGDVLSKNYKLISKNITPDMIDKVEMIDKYNSNPVLKNLTNSQKQIMNLILKNPKKLRTFGNLKAAVGIEDKLNLGGNMFVINSKIKSMIISNHNNIGQSPYSEFSIDQQFAKTREYEFDQTAIPNYITENNLFLQSFLTTNRNSLFNNSTLGVINNSYRINKKLVFNLFTDFYKDKVNQYQQSIIQNNLFPILSYNENITKTFSPLNFNNNFEVKYNTKKSQLLFAASSVYKKYSENDILNSLNNFKIDLASTYNRYALGAYYTHRIDSLKAFEISIQYNYDYKKQSFIINQEKYRILDGGILTNLQQQIANNKIGYITGEFKYFFKKKSANEISLKATYFDSKLNTALSIKDNLNNNYYIPNYSNETTILNNDLVLKYKTNFILGKKFSCNSDIGVLLNINNANNNLTRENNNKLFLIPKIGFTYSFSSKQQISANLGLDASYPNLSNTHLNPLLFSYRSIKTNKALPNVIQSLKYGVDYSYLDFNNATSFIFSYTHSSQLLSEIRSYKFSPDFDYTNLRYERVPQKFDNIYTKFDKYIYSINTGISIKNSLLRFSNPIEVEGNIRSNNFMMINSSLTIRPKFDKNINSSLGLDYTLNKDVKSGFTSFQFNPFTDITSTITKKFSLGARVNYFYTDYAVERLNYVFSNFYAFYTIKPQKIEAKFSLVNLFNTNVALSGNVSTVISKSVSTQILPRFGLVEFTYKF